ncbi:MAG: metallophosphoesterase [Planctomycetes bacterium]|nr:metallophosphoesterase [Planctomycetota bacterium]
MSEIDRRTAIKVIAAGTGVLALAPQTFGAQDAVAPFGGEFPNLESLTTGEWWTRGINATKPDKTKPKADPPSAPSMDVPRDQVVAFAVYTHHNGVLKMSAQLFPLKPGEERVARLEFQRDGQWIEAARADVLYPGWDAHFRVEHWDAAHDVPYRVRHGAQAMFEGLIRRDPVDKDEIVVANMSCNSSRTTGERAEIVANLKLQNPDLLFFGGDQTYRHTEHTAGWIEFGLQFRDIIRDRPAICIPDDHDVGHGNVWGESGKQSKIPGDADGGYRYPVPYVNQVQRQQSWHLPDPVDPVPVQRGIEVYFTRLTLGGVDFAILEDRKFKTGPAGKIPQMGPRPDHINDPSYDPKSIDLPGLELLGPRQEKFLNDWTQDWTGAEMKCVLSQTAFCGAVHMHGGQNDRLLADLDCNGWPQTARNRAVEIIRRAWAVHLCGDQHLAVVVKHGVNEFGDGPYGFTSPALVNTIYGRWWHPLDEQPGPNPVANSPLPWTGDFHDGLGNKISMLAYANPVKIQDEKQRADGYGLVRFRKQQRTITLECWPRFSDAREGDRAQFPGWPITIAAEANDGRKVVGHLPELQFTNAVNPVVQVVEDATGEILYAVRIQGTRFQPRVYSAGPHTVKFGRHNPSEQTLAGLKPQSKSAAGQRSITL